MSLESTSGTRHNQTYDVEKGKDCLFQSCHAAYVLMVLYGLVALHLGAV